MSWFDLPRVPEPEVMDDGEEVEAYSSAAAQSYLSALDDTLIEHAARLVGQTAARTDGRALDIGAGPGQIAFKLARRFRGWRIMGIDRSPSMIVQALAERARMMRAAPPGTGDAAERVEFMLADGGGTPFADGTFDLVLCNSVLHHLEDPEQLLREMARVAKPAGAILLRDLRRPSRPALPWHIRLHGRHYAGAMRKLYRASVRAAYRPEELVAMLCAAPIGGARVFTWRATHLGIEREAR